MYEEVGDGASHAFQQDRFRQFHAVNGDPVFREPNSMLGVNDLLDRNTTEINLEWSIRGRQAFPVAKLGLNSAFCLESTEGQHVDRAIRAMQIQGGFRCMSSR